MDCPLFVVDAFAGAPFEGNPAAVGLPPGEAPEAWMRRVAAEMNLSETAFVRPLEEDFELRWFTPSVEVDLCGHATLASAHILWEEGRLPREAPVRFRTRGGPLSARHMREEIELDFPRVEPRVVPPPPELGRALGVSVVACARARDDLLVEVASEAVLREMRPDLGLLARLPARGIAVTSPSDAPAYDYVCRFFAPRVGVPEDPVTGSAQCSLGPFWGERLGKRELRAYQASPRGGSIRVRLGEDRVHLGGRAVTVLRGRLVV
ncbi:MAG TPA: PhzF family phenazine biosynthesis protein [Planctomycetota bacterium]|jgi:predicted PhzF superfamily epimerase YddE/YHI9|nr:PhzF family phenazine biosynthesis protein [Planctomycetota bacterium]